MQKFKKTLFLLIAILCFVITLTAVANATCSHNWVEIDQKGADCEMHYVTYRCSLCYEYKNVNLAATQSHKWQEAYKIDATCLKDGYANYYCSECFATKTETIKSAGGHDYTFIYNDDATCTKDGTKIGTCKKCGSMDIIRNEGSAKGHKFTGDWVVIRGSTCQTQGVSKRDCSVCGVGDIRYDELGAHSDKDKDYKCDVCKTDLSPEQGAGSGSDKDDKVIKECSCKCHKGGIAGFFWKIGNFFNKLFKIKSKQICACGVYHF